MPSILITGASSGFGLQTARHFLDRDWSVMAAMRSPRPDLLPTSDRLRVIPLDVTEPADAARVADEVGPIDALVNNAGAGLLSALEGTSIPEIRDLFEVNAFGPMALTRAFLPGLRHQGSGVIVNISSAVTLKPLPLLSAYTASKAALEAFSENLALEVEPFGLRVRVVLPGRAPETAFGATARARSANGVPAAYADWAKAVFSAPPAHPEEVTTATDVAEAVWQAVIDTSSPFRIPAGADAARLAKSVGQGQRP